MEEHLVIRIIRIIRDSAIHQEVIPPHFIPRGSGEGIIKAVIFDVYGTLFTGTAGAIDKPGPTQQQVRQINALMRQYGVEKEPTQIRQDFYREIKREHKRLKAQGIDYPEVRYEEIWAKVLGTEDEIYLKTFAAAYEMIVNPVFPMPRLEEMLKRLKQKKMRMGIISNAQFFTPLLFPAFLEKTLEELGFDPGLLFYSYQTQCAKPSDCLYRKAGAVLAGDGISPHEVMYVGNDMHKDIQPAQQVGFKAILFAGDHRTHKPGQEEGEKGIIPDGIITELDQVLKYL